MNSPTSSPSNLVRQYAIPGGWVILFLTAVFAYLPGLSGPFLFDDFGSIAALGDYGGVVDWHTFKTFVFGGDSGPTGRPLALFTFLFDANNWPADPYPFKRTNLVIHLINGALLGVLTSRILGVLGWQSRAAREVALVSAACWLLHPFLVSTTLYVVQRMAQLSVLFIFLGMLSYLHGRLQLTSDRLRAYAWMSLSVIVFTFLGTISKENGLLLPVLIGVMELTIFASRSQRIPWLRAWSVIFLLLPACVVALYLGERLFRPGFFDIVPPRDFSIWERLLTEPRVLIDYLRHWFLPELYTTGVFQDHFLKSTGLLTPITTILAIIFHGALVVLAVIKRKAWPVFAFAVLFFYGGHLLESTTLNLELYFEHRNYLAAAFLFLPLIAFLHAKLGRRTFALVAVGMLVLLSGMTRYSATVWAAYDSIVEASVHKAPTSVRAQSQYALMLYDAGRIDEAILVMDTAISNRPEDNTTLLMFRILLLCQVNRLTLSEFDDVRERVSRLPFNSGALKIYTDFPTAVVEQRCPGIPIEAVRPLFADMLAVPHNADPKSLAYSHIQYLIGYVDAFSGMPEQALEAFRKSLASRPGTSHAMAMAALMASSGYNEEALILSEAALARLRVEATRVTRPAHGITEADIRGFQETVREDLEALQRGDTSDPVQ